MSSRTDADDWQHERVRTNGVGLHCVTAGPSDGDLVVLLHGFPECWCSWYRQIPALVAAGFRVVAPDMRGYNRSDKPSGVAPYDIGELVADVAGLIDHAGRERAHVVGHDWGGVVAWRVGIDYPELLDRLVVLNAPHPDAYRRDLLTTEQLRRSWYAVFFQLPWLPEQVLQYDDFAALERMLTEGTVRAGAFTDADIEQYKRAFRRDGAPTAALNYYRALFRRMVRREARALLPGGSRPSHDVWVPTLLVWGEQDPALCVSLSEGLDEWVPDLRVERFPDAGHWVHADASERVNDLLVEYLSG